MRSKAIVTCPCCEQEDGWRFAEAAYVRALLEEGDEDLTEGFSGGYEGSSTWRFRDHPDVARDIARELADVAAQPPSLKGAATTR
jgi:hypothetical protein